MSFDCKHEHIEIKTLSETYEILGDIVQTNSKVKVCKDCGEKIFDTDISRDNILQAYSKYRKNHGLLMHEELKKARENLGISRYSMAVLLGVDPDEVRRHEDGAIQTFSYDKKIRKLMTLEGLAEVMVHALRITGEDEDGIINSIHRLAGSQKKEGKEN